MRKSIIDLAIDLAHKCTFHRQKHGCVIFKNKQIISTGYNQKRYCKILDPKYKNWIDSLHAEQKAIIFSNIDLKRSSILIVRINRKNMLAYSKPCNICLSLIKDVGISHIYYSNEYGQIQKLESP